MKTLPPLPTRSLITLLAAVLAVTLAGCGKPAGPDRGPAASTPPASSAAPLPLESILASWQQGDKDGAVRRFVETDWKSGSPFGPGSPLNHRESELAGMSAAARDQLLKEVNAQVGQMKSMAMAVRDQGRAAVATDPALARRCFTRLDEFGAALNQPEGLKLVQLVGQALRKLAAAETASLDKQTR